MARASDRSTPEYAMSLNRAKTLDCFLDCELYTVTRAEDVTASWYGYASAKWRLVTCETALMKLGALYARQYRPSAVSRRVLGAYRLGSTFL
jgi:hypothetical protein